MKKQIWIYAETNKNTISSVYYELLSKAKTLAEEIGDTDIAAVVLGNQIDESVAKLKESGADVIYMISNKRLEDYNCQGYAAALETLARKYQPEMLFIGATAVGAELAPTVAAKLKTGLAAHCVDIRKGNDRVNFMVPAFGGKVVSEIYIPNTRPMMASVRPGILSANALQKNEQVQIIEEDGAFLDEVPVLEELVEIEEAEQIQNDIAESDIVIAAGRGVDKATWENINRLADKIGAAVGWTRSFVDSGLVEDERQMIGTSGKSIHPKLCLTFGISGASHFTSGITKSNIIISVNRDKDAAIFNSSDYGVMNDAGTIVAELLKRFQD